jgi:hypothetical protein
MATKSSSSSKSSSGSKSTASKSTASKSSSSPSTKSVASAYSQAGKSMLSAGVSSVGGKTTSPSKSTSTASKSVASPSKSLTPSSKSVASPSKSGTASSKPSGTVTKTNVVAKSPNAGPSKSAVVNGYNQAAKSMKSAGVASLGGKTYAPTKSAASKPDGAVAYQQRQAETKAIAAAKTKAGYTQFAQSMKDTGVSGIGVKPSGKAINNNTIENAGKGAAGLVGFMSAADAKAAKLVRDGGSAITINGNAKNFSANASKAAALSGNGSFWQQVKSNYNYGSLYGLSTNPLPTKPASKTSTYVNQTLKANAPWSLSNAGKLVKGAGIVGAALDPAMGAWNGYANTPAKASVNEKITNAIVGGLKQVDNVAVSGVAGVAVGTGASFVTTPVGGAIAGTAAGVAAGKVYGDSDVDTYANATIEYAKPAVRYAVDIGVPIAKGAYEIGSAGWQAASGLFRSK